MSTRKHKRKAVVKHANKNMSSKYAAKHPSLFSKYPRIFFYLGALLIVTGIYLLIIGMQNNAKVGLAMLSIFAGTATVIFANSALPKKAIKE